MAKMIAAHELAEIVGKILNGDVIGESAAYSRFMTDIAQVVSDHCGGEVLNPASNDGGNDWQVGIHWNDSVPPDGGVWSAYDTDVDWKASHSCDNCGGTFNEESLILPIPDLDQRVDEGGEVPSGECPTCGALCYPIKSDDVPAPSMHEPLGSSKRQGTIQSLIEVVAEGGDEVEAKLEALLDVGFLKGVGISNFDPYYEGARFEFQMLLSQHLAIEVDFSISEEDDDDPVTIYIKLTRFLDGHGLHSTNFSEIACVQLHVDDDERIAQVAGRIGSEAIALHADLLEQVGLDREAARRLARKKLSGN